MKLAAQRSLTELEQLGVIQGFVGIIGSKNATREAFQNELLADGQVWMDMIKAQPHLSHPQSSTEL